MAQVKYPEEEINRLIQAGKIERAKAQLLEINLSQLSPIDISLHCSFFAKGGAAKQRFKDIEAFSLSKI